MNTTHLHARWLMGFALAALMLPLDAQPGEYPETPTSETQEVLITPIPPIPGPIAEMLANGEPRGEAGAPVNDASSTSASSGIRGRGPLPADSPLTSLTPPDPVTELRFNFQGVPLDTVLNYMSQAAGFIIVRSAEIDGRVNVISQQPLNADQAVELLNTVLNEKDLAAIRNDRTLTIVTREEAKRREIPVIKGNEPTQIPKSDKMVTQIIPVRFANAKQLVTDLASLIPEHASMTANESSNTIVLTDTQGSVRRITEIIQGLDSSISEVSTLRVFKLDYADAKSAADLIKAIYTSTQTAASGDDLRRQIMQRFGRGGGGGDQAQTQTPDNAVQQASAKVMAAADERTNSLVVSASEQTMENIELLIATIDTETNALTEVRVFTLQFADATQTAEVIKGVFAAQTTAQQTAQQQQNQGGNRRFRGPQQQPAATDTQSSRQKTESTVLAVPDTRTNSVIVSASESAMEQIASMVKELDNDPAKNKRVFVYSLKNANPEEVALLLGDMFAGNATGGSSAARSTGNTARGSTGSSNSNNNNSNRSGSSSTRGSSGSSGSSFSR